MHENSRLLFERYATPHFTDGQRVLEIGPDGDPSSYRQALPDVSLVWETAELADALMPSADGFRPAAREPTYTMSSEYEIPVADGAFDVVLAGQVIEHVRRIWAWMPELARVTRPGDKLIAVNPISWPFHPAPYDCWRIYPDGMQALCDEAGLEVLLSRFETLERAPSRRTYHNVGYDWINPRGVPGWRKRLKALLGWPVPTALDLITIAQKPEAG